MIITDLLIDVFFYSIMGCALFGAVVLFRKAFHK